MEGESSSPSQPPRPAIGAASRRPSFLTTAPNPLDQITFEDCLKQLAAFDGQLQGQQQHLKGLQINLTKYIDRVKPGTIITSDQTATYMQMTKHSSNTSLSHGYGHGQWRGTSALMKLSNMSISESIESMALKYREKKGLVLGTSKDSLASQVSLAKPKVRTFDSSSKFSDRDKKRRSSFAAGILGDQDVDVRNKSSDSNISNYEPPKGGKQRLSLLVTDPNSMTINMPEEDEKKSIYSSRRRSSFLRNPMPNIFKADAEEMPQIDSQISYHDNGTSQDAVILSPHATHTSENEPPPLPNSETKAPEPQAVPEKKKEPEKYKLVKWLLIDPVYQDFGGNHSKQSQPKSSTATKEEFHFGIHPLSRFNVLWEFALSFVYLFALFEIPVVASFSNTSIQSTPISEALTIVFGTATFLKFVTLTFSPFLQLNILRYLTSSFLLDLAGTIPFDTLLINHINFPDTLLLIRLLHVCNIVRIFNTNPIYVTLSHLLQKTFKVGSSFMSIFMLGGVLITFLHLHGCFIFLFGKLTHFESASWIAVEEILHVTMTEQYIWAYFAAVANTFPITGYQPSDPFEQVFSIVAALVGAVLYAILVGTISSFSFGLDSSGRRYKEKIDEVHEYMTYRKLSEPIKVKVRQYYELKYKGKYFDEDAILNEMNESLKQEIAVHNCRDLIAKVPFLNREVGDGRDAHFLARIAKVLRPVYYIKGDLIFDQGWVGNEMYFIQQGCVAIIVNGNRVGELRDGAFFGEVALLGEMPRTATIMAAGNTILYSFGRADFSTILKDYEDMALRIKLVFEERMAKIQKEKDAKLRLEAEKNQQ